MFENNIAQPLATQSEASGNNNAAYFFLTVALFQKALISPIRRQLLQLIRNTPGFALQWQIWTGFLCGFRAGLDPTELFQDQAWFGSIRAAIDLNGQFSLGCVRLLSMSDMDWQKLHEEAGQCGLPGILGNVRNDFRMKGHTRQLV